MLTQRRSGPAKKGQQKQMSVEKRKLSKAVGKWIVVGVTSVVFISIYAGNLQANGKRGKKQTVEFVDGFHDSRTPGVLCPWEQLNQCEGRKEVFVKSATKTANGTNYYYDYAEAQQGHVDICMHEKDAPTGIVLLGFFPFPIDLDSDNGCESPCNLLLRPRHVNRLSCHENDSLDQSQAVLNYYSLETIRSFTRDGDNYFCHEDYLPPNVTPEECLASTSTYCFRGKDSDESVNEYEDYLDQCLDSVWTE